MALRRASVVTHDALRALADRHHFVKVLNESGLHYSHQYRIGENWCRDFEDDLLCGHGFHFTTMASFPRFINTNFFEEPKQRSSTLWDVHFSNESKVVQLMTDVWKTNCLVLSNPRHIWSNPALCLEAVNTNGCLLEHVLEPLKTYDICRTAVQRRGIAIEHVPFELMTEDLTFLAIRQNGTCLRFVHSAHKTADLCFAAVVENGAALAYVPEKFKTRELCNKAFENSWWALNFMPEEFITAEMCYKAVLEDGGAFQCIPKHFQTEELRRLSLIC
jgi:hypothetical protein